MPFIPHTQQDIRTMLDTIGVESIESLFDEIPAGLRQEKTQKQAQEQARGSEIPPRMSEMEITRLMTDRAAGDQQGVCFIGAGAYDHHIPSAVWQIATRGEFYSAYTPYQAEASQGTLQLLYEYQTMMARLTGMEVSNASLYDGASALAEAVLMAARVRQKPSPPRILVPRTLHPKYRRVAHAIVKNQGIVLEELDYDRDEGFLDPDALPAEPGDFTALVIPQPNFFGNLEEVDALTHWAHQRGALVIAVVNPISLALLRPPGEWGQEAEKGGADIVCGDGQPLGAPLASGGPYFGFLCARERLARKMPGRIVGRTADLDGNPGYTLTLQTREQHIRRAKATSNICTNQGLLVTAATLYMSLMGPEGLAYVAEACHDNTRTLMEKLTSITGVEKRFHRPLFHEAVLALDRPVGPVLERLLQAGVLGGYALAQEYPELGNALLVCATETRTIEDITRYAHALRDIMG